MTPERRQRRSTNRAEAAQLFFTALQRKTRSRSIVVADEQGLLVVGVGEGDHEAIAALGGDAVPDAKVHGARFEWEGAPLQMYSVDGAQPSVSDAASAFSRIFSSR